MLTIGEIARRAGIRPSAIRYYESVGLLPAPPRVSGQRRYTEDILDHLAAIRLAQDAGFTVAEVRTLMHDATPGSPLSARWHALATHKLAEVERQIARGHAMKALLEEGLRCGCLTLDDCALFARTLRQEDNTDSSELARRPPFRPQPTEESLSST